MNGQTTTFRDQAGSQRVAVRTVTTNPASTSVAWLVGDHPSAALRTGLGSTSLTLDASGNVAARLLYQPWGETRHTWGSTPTA